MRLSRTYLVLELCYVHVALQTVFTGEPELYEN